MPGSYFIVMLGKLVTYTIVSLIQFGLMLSVGLFILPLLGMPQLNIGDNLPLLSLIALSAGLAATGFGLLVGTVATTHDQASLFGAVFIIILAAIGGVWVPTFVMPDIMRRISVISPLNWGLESFYAVFIRNSSLKDIWPEIVKLWVFFIATLGGSYLFQKYKRLQ
jgi:ABC-2 type transport system permease protein